MKPYYDHAGITIYHGDCREVLPTLGTVDLVLSDPPYGIGVDRAMHATSGQRSGRGCARKGSYSDTAWDDQPPEAATLASVIAAGLNSCLWGGNYFALPPARCVLVWDKENGDTKFADCELAWTTFDMPVRIYHHMWNGMIRKGRESRFGHPTQKPLALMAWCILLAPDPKVILDPFMGSGTTLRAAKDLGRRAIGIEIEERYCEIAAKRLSQEVLAL